MGLESPHFVEAVNDKVNKYMHLLEDDYKTKPASTTPLHFKDILGASDNEYWWRLYINPKDWEAALQLQNPGQKYNEDAEETSQPKGFREGMVAGYQKYLIDGVLKQRLSSEEPLTVGDYREIFQTCQPLILGNQDSNIVPPTFRDINSPVIQFGSYQNLAADLGTEIIQLADQSGRVTNWLLLSRVAEDALSEHNPAMACIMSHAKGPLLENGISEVFRMFKNDITAAGLRSDQLRAIARLIRRLHILHPFTNGCGRTNVFTLLPLLLLHYGFGLPLGGEHGSTIPKGAIHMIFNGGCTVEEISRFLYVSQDFGLLHSTGGVLATTGCLGTKGRGPARP